MQWFAGKLQMKESWTIMDHLCPRGMINQLDHVLSMHVPFVRKRLLHLYQTPLVISSTNPSS